MSNRVEDVDEKEVDGEKKSYDVRPCIFRGVGEDEENVCYLNDNECVDICELGYEDECRIPDMVQFEVERWMKGQEEYIIATKDRAEKAEARVKELEAEVEKERRQRSNANMAVIIAQEVIAKGEVRVKEMEAKARVEYELRSRQILEQRLRAENAEAEVERLKAHFGNLNLCDGCENTFAECDANPTFGVGIGKDNVILCDKYLYNGSYLKPESTQGPMPGLTDEDLDDIDCWGAMYRDEEWIKSRMKRHEILHEKIMDELARRQAIGKGEQIGCPKCGQINKGQTGEYPCSACGLPMVWNSPSEQKEPDHCPECGSDIGHIPNCSRGICTIKKKEV